MYRRIFEGTFEFVGLLAPDGTLLQANRAALDFAGVELPDVVGRPMWETPWWPDSPEVREGAREAIRRAAGGEFVRYETEVCGAGGRRAVIDFSLTPVQDEAGSITGIIPEGRDITDRKRLEDALRLSEAKFRAIIDGAFVGIVAVDESQRIELFNDGAERIFGWKSGEILGQPLDVIIPPAYREAHRRHLEEFGRAPVTARPLSERAEIVGLRRNGEEFPAEASIAKVEVGGRRLYTAVLRDITERKEAEAERVRLLAEARAATRARDELMRVVAHDLQNPVTGMLMGIRLLEMRPEAAEPQVSELLRGMESAAQRLSRLARDLRDVDHIEAGCLSIEPRVMELGRLVEEAARTFTPQAAQRDISFAWETIEELPAVRADRDRLLQLLGNLLDNALKWTPRGGSIAVRLSRGEETVEVAVTDSGPGIPEEERPHVFDRFWRGSASARTGGSGMGLGLAIARGIVEGHGGRIWVESRPGEGSTFRFTLPSADTPGEGRARVRAG